MRGLVVSVALTGLFAFLTPVFAQGGPSEDEKRAAKDAAGEKESGVDKSKDNDSSDAEAEGGGDVEAEGKVEGKAAEPRPARPSRPAVEEEDVSSKAGASQETKEEPKKVYDFEDSTPNEEKRRKMRRKGRGRGRTSRRGGRYQRRSHKAELYKKKSPFMIRKGPYSLEIKAQLQVQAVTYVGKDALYENGDPATKEGILIRRARLGVRGKLPWKLRYNFMIEAFGDKQRGSSGEGLAGQYMGAELLDMSIEWVPMKEFSIGAGAEKVAGPRGRMVTSRALQLIERPITVEELAVDRRAGAWIGGELQYFNYLAGVYNGDDGVSFGNESGGYMVAARLELTPMGSMGDSFSNFGNTALHRVTKPRFGAGVSFQYAHGPATDSMSVSGDLGFKWRGLSVGAEAVYVREEPLEKPTVPTALPGITESLGVYGQAGYFILPERLEVAARFEYLDMNFDIDDSRDVWALTGGVNYYLSRYMRAQLSYTHKQELRHRQLQNDALLIQMQLAF